MPRWYLLNVFVDLLQQVAPPELLSILWLRQWPGSAGRLLRVGSPGLGARAFVMVPVSPPPPGSSVSWSLNLPGGIRRNPAAARRPTLPCRQCGGKSRVTGGRAHVGLLWVPRSPSGGETRATPLPRQKHRHPRPKGGRPAAKVTEAAPDTDSLRPGRAWRPPLPSPP